MSENKQTSSIIEEKLDYSLLSLNTKLTKSEQESFSNYYTDISDLLVESNIVDHTQDYFKKHISLTNSTQIEKSSFSRPSIKPKKNFFSKFPPETLFYMFYYMPRDSLQIYSADELYKRKWYYNYESNIWFRCIETNSTDDKKENNNSKQKVEYEYFHPFEWKIMKYVFGKVDVSKFVSETEINKYRSYLNY
jgi:CCR4-NOT transcriptional regulation complex NOT5 subunit